MRIYRTAVTLITCAALSLAAVAAEPEPVTEPAEGTETLSASQQEAKDLLMQMSNYLAGLEKFSVNMMAGFDVLHEDWQKIQFVESREILLSRPDNLKISERTGESGSFLIFDGEKMTVYDGQEKVYAQAIQPESVDDAILYIERDLDIRLPLAPLLTTWLPTELERRVQTIDYVETTNVFGQPAHHLAARTAALDFQVWVAAGERPLPLRIVLTYMDLGMPQYWAQFSNWNLEPLIDGDSFKFTPEPGASQIAFAIQVPAMPESTPAEDDKGDQP